MGFLWSVHPPGAPTLRLDSHEGDVIQLRLDHAPVATGAPTFAIEAATARWRAVCACGWEGSTVVDRVQGQSAYQDFHSLPVLGDEWTRHTVRHASELAGHATAARFDATHGESGRRPCCRGCGWVGDWAPTDEAARVIERIHHEAVAAALTVVRR